MGFVVVHPRAMPDSLSTAASSTPPEVPAEAPVLLDPEALHPCERSVLVYLLCGRMFVGASPDDRLGARLDYLAHLGLVHHYQPDHDEVETFRARAPQLPPSEQVALWVVTSTPTGHIFALRAATDGELQSTRRRLAVLSGVTGGVDPSLVERELERRAVGVEN